jgi:hypothetical protein
MAPALTCFSAKKGNVIVVANVVTLVTALSYCVVTVVTFIALVIALVNVLLCSVIIVVLVTVMYNVGVVPESDICFGDWTKLEVRTGRILTVVEYLLVDSFRYVSCIV